MTGWRRGRGMRLSRDITGWAFLAEVDDGAGSVMLVVSDVLSARGDPIGALDLETRQGTVCAGPVRFGEPHAEENGPPTVRFVIDPVPPSPNAPRTYDRPAAASWPTCTAIRARP